MRNLLSVLGIPLALAAFFVLVIALPGSQAPIDAQPQALERLNLMLLPDLSDRIGRENYPRQVEQDMAVVEALSAFFREEVQRKYFVASLDRFAVVLAPQKVNPDAFDYLDRMTIDMARLRPHERRHRLDSLIEDCRTHLDTLYAEAINMKRFWGTDLWRFFSELRVDTVSEQGSPIRNVLVIATDGYVIAEDNMYREKNRFSYMNHTSLSPFRERPNWEAEFERLDWGLLPIKRDLGNLEVLVIGARPLPYFNELAILRKFWTKWTAESEIRRFEMHESCQSSAECQQIVRRFLSNR